MDAVALSQHFAQVTSGTWRRKQERTDERVGTGSVVDGRVTGLLIVTLRRST